MHAFFETVTVKAMQQDTKQQHKNRLGCVNALNRDHRQQRQGKHRRNFAGLIDDFIKQKITKVFPINRKCPHNIPAAVLQKQKGTAHQC